MISVLSHLYVGLYICMYKTQTQKKTNALKTFTTIDFYSRRRVFFLLRKRNFQLKTLHFEIKADIGDVVKGTLGQIEPHQLVGGGILVADST